MVNRKQWLGDMKTTSCILHHKYRRLTDHSIALNVQSTINMIKEIRS